MSSDYIVLPQVDILSDVPSTCHLIVENNQELKRLNIDKLTVAVDNSLTESGQPADAQVVGSRLSTLTNQLNNTNTQLNNLSNQVNNLADNISVAVLHIGTDTPSNTNLLWVDTTADVGGLKYYNGTAWTHVPVAYS